MKNIFGKFATLLLFASSMATAQVSDPVLLRINGKDIHRSEFEYAYNKNNNNLSDGAQSVEEYLPMFINFKLKVAEAEALHLDTLSSLREEFQRDRALMAESYLVDEDFIAQEAYSIYANDSATIGKDGFVKFSHIVFVASQKDDRAAVELARQQADSAHLMLQAGKSFEEVATHFSIPAQALAPFEILRGQAYPEFEEVAFALADGDYSAPFETPMGFHIVKRFSSRPFGSFEQYKPAIINMLEQQNIRDVAKIKRGEQLAAEFGGGITPMEAIAREDSLLETKYPEFGNLMREYYEGLLFFEVSNREVWSGISDDESGMKRYFRKNKKRYAFETPRFRGALVLAKSQENLDLVKSIIDDEDYYDYKSLLEAKLPADSSRVIRVELGIFAVGDNPWIDKLVFGQGEGAILRNGFTVVDVVGEVIEKPESYRDVKGLLLVDYQKYCEDKWVEKLRDKYDVYVDENVLRTVNNHD